MSHAAAVGSGDWTEAIATVEDQEHMAIALKTSYSGAKDHIQARIYFVDFGWNWFYLID